MVLEHIFPEDWLERKGFMSVMFVFLLGFIYSTIGLAIAGALFPTDPMLVAVTFTALLILPELYKIFSIEERKESLEQKISLFELWKDDMGMVKIYLTLFISIVMAYALVPLLLPKIVPHMGNILFVKQIEAISVGGFLLLLKKNLFFLLAIFVIALITGDGAAFLITWKASVFGTLILFSSHFWLGLFTGDTTTMLNSLIFIGSVLSISLITVASYACAAIAGSIISKDVLLEQFASHRFFEVFGFNLYLLLVGLVILLIGVGVETWFSANVSIFAQGLKEALTFGGIL
ncbi:hypothetical protein COV12_01140 [Candidatus Woesearchaeota archaeon CG10_big_fil_rev_8_21_14_0_10_32_24]|nr:MAG: hypothetical protein COV12_01140 [Candidatus Woesearchaeota archaeon CG10_big_fil_rev_8_21_14_0_10_32_24]